MTDGEGRCITAICSFPGEESVAIEIPFSGERNDYNCGNCLFIINWIALFADNSNIICRERVGCGS